ncbi:32559_t:CDS:10 [Gigaspora margarita]|uniref:32559_t:CDS:1 n=1 Tax=Gigaspora margarita TaxID=4874 RepID=A0ABM8VWK9_GIGMA|nr:32559_t:CDS:10 [Gigaspora margarita]
MSEEFLQKDLINNYVKIGENWRFYKIGNTTINQLKKLGIIRALPYESIENKKVDGIIMEHKKAIAILENKLPENFNTQNKKQKAIQQEIEVAKKLKANLFILTDGQETLWINVKTGNKLKYPFDEKDPNLKKFVGEILDSINKNNDKILPKKIVDPTSLAKQYKNSTPDAVLKNYARSIRPEIKELFPESRDDGTTIINGTIFVNKKDKAVGGYGSVFKKVLERFKNNGELKNIDYDFKIVRAVNKMAGEPKEGMKICDPACGVGKFPLEFIKDKLDELFEIKNNKVIKKIEIVGFDKGFGEREQKTIILAKANMLIYFCELIKNHPKLTEEFAKLFNESFILKTDSILEGKIDLILTNPPYVMSGSSNLKREIDRSSKLKNYYKTNAMGLEALKPGTGRAFIVIPDGILTRQNDKKLRKFILDNCYIDALISLPIDTFFRNSKKTYILALTKKNNISEKQTGLVFTYLVSEIGESRDINRFRISQDDLDEAAELFNSFKGKELIELEIIKKEDIAGLNTFSGLIGNISDKLKDFSSSIKEISKNETEPNDFKEILISDIFEIKKGSSKYTKKFIDENPGEYPVYSSQTVNEGIIGKINSYDYDCECLTWATDGYAGIVFPRKGKFSMTTHCGALIPKKNQNLSLDFIYWYLSENLKEYAVGSQNKRLTVEIIKNVKIKIPINQKGEFDVSKQKEIVEKYQHIKELRDLVKLEKQKINDLVINIEEKKFTLNKKIGEIFDLSVRTNGSKFTKYFINDYQGEIPVYGATKDENIVYGKIKDDLPFIKYFENFFFRQGRFSLSVDVSPLIIGNAYKDKFFLPYLRYVVEKELMKQDFDFSNKASKGKIKNIEIKIPITPQDKVLVEHLLSARMGRFDPSRRLVKQKEIAEKYKQIENIKVDIAGLRITEAISFNPELKHPEPEYQDLYLLRGKRKKDQFLRRVRYDLNISSHIELAPHTLRRCFATYNLLAGMPLNILQKFLGHSRVSTTALYIKDRSKSRELKELFYRNELLVAVKGKKSKVKVQEKQNDGTTKEVEKEVDNLTKHYFEERDKLIKNVTDKEKVLKEKGGYTDIYVNLASAYDELKELHLSKDNIDKDKFAAHTNTLPSGITDLGKKIDNTTSITAPMDENDAGQGLKDKIFDQNRVEGYTDKKFKNSDKDTASIINHFFDVYDHTSIKGKYAKLKDSFDNNPAVDLLNNLLTFDEKTHSFTDGTNNFTLHNFPKYFYEKQKDLYRLQGLRDSELKRLDSGGEELRKAQEELDKAKQELKAGEKNITDRITEAIAEKRKILKDKYKIDDATYNGFTKTSSEDNRISFIDMLELNHLFRSICYLQTGNEEDQSSVNNENTARTDLKNLNDRVHQPDRNTDEGRLIEHVNQFMQGADGDNQKRIEVHKEYVEEVVDGFDKLEELIKLPQHYIEAREAVKNEVEGLLKKVMVSEGTAPNITYKVKQDFIDNYLKKADAEVDDLAKMFTKLNAENIIKLIKLFEYEKVSDENTKKEVRKKYSWDRKKKVDQKYVEENGDYTLAEDDKEDFQKFLFELATDAKKLNEITKPVEETPQREETPAK